MLLESVPAHGVTATRLSRLASYYQEAVNNKSRLNISYFALNHECAQQKA